MSEKRSLALHSLSFAGQILVWSGRQWIEREIAWPQIETEFAGPFGAEIGRDDLYTLLHLAAIRPMVFGAWMSREVRHDEALIVRLVEMEQRHQSAWTASLLKEILPPTEARQALALVAKIAHLLDLAGYKASVAQADEIGGNPARHAAPQVRKATLH